MRVKCIRVKNFRSIRDETLEFNSLTALVGANGSGKSSFLHSLQLFQAKQPRITTDDFYKKNTDEDIVFAITFSNLSDSAKKEFSEYLSNEELTVKRRFTLKDDKIESMYHGLKLQNQNFKEIRECAKAGNAKEKYNKLRKRGDYSKLPEWESKDKAMTQLCEWEKEYPEKCKRIEDDGKFFGFGKVGSGQLGKYVNFLYIPAVRDASLDANEGKDSALKELMDILIRKSLGQKEEVKSFQKEVKDGYDQLFKKNSSKEISDLSESLTETLNRYVPDVKIHLSLKTENFELKLPSATVNLIEDDYKSTVERTGHGLQRAFIITILQYLSSINPNNGIELSDTPTLVLIIEEPELYQHPNRQRHLSEICFKLSEMQPSRNSSQTQVVYSTHSPYFVELDRIQNIRLLQKTIIDKDDPKATKIFSTNLESLADKLNELHGRKHTSSNITSLLNVIRNPWVNEGFFSKVAVLVEGDSDRAAVLGAARCLGKDLESMGISVIPCSGKNNLDKPAIIFCMLKIPTYVIWDNDKKDKGNNDLEKKTNRILLKIHGEPEEDFPHHVKPSHACLEGTLENMLQKEIGSERYNKMLSKYTRKYNLERKHADKNLQCNFSNAKRIWKRFNTTYTS